MAIRKSSTAKKGAAAAKMPTKPKQPKKPKHPKQPKQPKWKLPAKADVKAFITNTVEPYAARVQERTENQNLPFGHKDRMSQKEVFKAVQKDEAETVAALATLLGRDNMRHTPVNLHKSHE